MLSSIFRVEKASLLCLSQCRDAEAIFCWFEKKNNESFFDFSLRYPSLITLLVRTHLIVIGARLVFLNKRILIIFFCSVYKRGRHVLCSSNL